MKIFIFKTDGIGDLVLATGSIRLLAKEFGEENLTIAVLPSAGDLAKAQFPRARIISLPLTTKRKVLNLFLANLLQIFPVWWALLPEKFDIVLSLRHSRKFLHSFFIAALRSRKKLVAENQLSQGGHIARGWVEKALWKLRKATVVPYPKSASVPLELEMHRRLLDQAISAPVRQNQIAPALTAAPGISTSNSAPILLCPFSSMKSKDYPAASWIEVFSLLTEKTREIPIELAGDAGQRGALESMAEELNKFGYSKTFVREPESLPDFTRAVARAHLVLTVDTAAAHIACALDRPTIVIFSGLHCGVYAPWTTSERQMWLESEPPPAGEPPRKKSHWHRGISPASVASAIQKLQGAAGEVTARQSRADGRRPANVDGCPGCQTSPQQHGIPGSFNNSHR